MGGRSSRLSWGRETKLQAAVGRGSHGGISRRFDVNQIADRGPRGRGRRRSGTLRSLRLMFFGISFVLPVLFLIVTFLFFLSVIALLVFDPFFFFLFRVLIVILLFLEIFADVVYFSRVTSLTRRRRRMRAADRGHDGCGCGCGRRVTRLSPCTAAGTGNS